MNKVYEKIKRERQKILFSCLLCITIGATFILLHSSLYEPGNILSQTNLGFSLYRIEQYAYALQHGDFSDKVSSFYFHGFGYAIGMFYPSIFLLPAAVMRLLDIPVLLTYKVYLLLLSAASFGSFYYVSKKILMNKGISLVLATLYMCSHYRIVDFAFRGALGETLAFIFAPFVFLGLYGIFYSKKYSYWIYVTLGMSGLLYAHLISAFMLVQAVAFWIIVYSVDQCIYYGIQEYKSGTRDFKESKKSYLFKRKFYARIFLECYELKLKLFALLKATGLTILITSYSLFPMFEQMLDNIFKYRTEVESGQFSYYARTFAVPFGITGISQHHLGYFLLVLPILLCFVTRKRTPFMIWTLVLGYIFYILTLNLELWKYVDTYKTIISYIQFPYRLSFLSTLFLMFAMILQCKEGFYWDKRKIYSMLFLFLLLIANYGYLYNFSLTGDLYYQDRTGIRIKASDIQDPNFFQSKNRNSFHQVGKGEYVPYQLEPSQLMKLTYDDIFQMNRFQNMKKVDEYDKMLRVSGINLSSQVEVILPRVYYKGYTYKVFQNNRIVDSGKAYESASGLTAVKVHTLGTVEIQIDYHNTIITWISFLLTLIGLSLFLYILKCKQRYTIFHRLYSKHKSKTGV